MKWLRNLFAPMKPLFSSLRATWRAGILGIFRPIGRWFAFLFWSTVRWAAGLQLRLLLQGLPALIIGGGAIWVLCFAAFTPIAEIETKYLDRAKSAVAGKDYPMALVCYERVASLRSDRDDVIYDMAITLEKNGQIDRCAQLMNQIASLESDTRGYADAHFWLGTKWVSARPRTVESAARAEAHLSRAIYGRAQHEDSAEAQIGDLYVWRRKLPDAEEHFKQALLLKKNPHIRLRLAEIYAMQGKRKLAEDEARKSMSDFTLAAEADIGATEERLLWAKALVMLEDFDKAIAVLNTGLTRTSKNEYRVALAQVYAARFDHAGRQGNQDMARRIGYLREGLRDDAKSIPILERMLAVATMRHNTFGSLELATMTVGLAGTSSYDVAAYWGRYAGAEAEQAHDTLMKIDWRTNPSPEIHWIMGLAEWTSGNHKDARFHWEQAYSMNPNNAPAVANNLAVVLGQYGNEKDLKTAIQLANQAVAKEPNQLNYRDTRGRIVYKLAELEPDQTEKMKLYEKAEEDMRYSLRASPDPAETYEFLAVIYEKLGLPHQREQSLHNAKKLREKKGR